MKITNIEFEFSEWAEGFDPEDANADVYFELEDHTLWCAAFFTYKNLETLTENYRQSGECLSGEYFCADKPIFISRLDKELIAEVLDDIVSREKDLSAVFTKVGK